MLRASYADPALFDEVFELLGYVFRGIDEQEQASRDLGMRWEACSTPFVVREHGRIVSHVGVLDIPVVMNGERRSVGSVHAVATHPDHRRRGHYRAIMGELLPWCDERFETLHLTTDHPEYFEPFDFRIIDECHFEAPCSPANTRSKAEPLADRSRLAGFLERRTPVSHALGTWDRNVFLFNEARRPVYELADLDVLVSYDLSDGCLKLWDIVGARIPPLELIVERLAGEFSRIEVHFAPELVGGEWLAPVEESRAEDVLMARGPYPVEGQPVKWPVPSRC